MEAAEGWKYPPPPPSSLSHLSRPKKLFCRGESPNRIVKLPAVGGKKQRNSAKLCCAPLQALLQNGLLKQETVRMKESKRLLCNAFTSVALFQFQPQFSFFVKKHSHTHTQRESCLRVPPSPPPSCPLPLPPALSSVLLPQPRRK